IFKGKHDITIDEAFSVMYLLVSKMFEDDDVEIETYEIEQSYCPGKFELSINGKKLAGISQRRDLGGIAGQVYLCVEGDGSERAALMKAFYERALQGERTKFEYPDIDPQCMASLSQLLGRTLTVHDAMSQLIYALKDLSGNLTKEDITD